MYFVIIWNDWNSNIYLTTLLFYSFLSAVVVYGDHSLYIWDIHDVNKVISPFYIRVIFLICIRSLDTSINDLWWTYLDSVYWLSVSSGIWNLQMLIVSALKKFQASRCCVLVSHSACIWDVKNLFCDNMHDPALVCAARGCSGGISFATCSADGTIRLWDLVLQTEISGDSLEQHSSTNRSMATVHLGNSFLCVAHQTGLVKHMYIPSFGSLSASRLLILLFFSFPFFLCSS